MVDYENPYQDKIDKDEKNLIKLRAGTVNQQLIDAAYLGARQEPTETQVWLNAAESGITSFTEAIARGKIAREFEIDKMNGQIDSQIDTLNTTGYSLGSKYYEAANTYTKGLREEYLAAEGDPEKQNQIKMELNLASQSIAGTKDAIEKLGIAWNPENPDESDLERSGLTPEQLRIIEVVTDKDGAYAVWDNDKNTFVWKDPTNGKTYTIEDINKIQNLASRDFEGKEEYIKDEQLQAENGLLFKEDGTGEAFNSRKQTFTNEKRITKQNINFYINGDFTNDGTPSFKDEFQNHPDFDLTKEDNVIFKALEASGKYPDRPGSPEGFDLTDMPDPSPEIPGYSPDDLVKLAENVYNAVTDETADGYDFKITKSLVAEYMTLRQKNAFYGGNVSKIEEIDPEDYDDIDNYIADGGNIGYANKVMGYTWVPPNPNGKNRKEKRGYWNIDPSKGFKAKFSGIVL